jgi:hypothetical protein
MDPMMGLMGGGPAPLGPPPGMPKPGQGMDPMMAMLNGMPMMQPMGPPPAPPGPPGPVMGPDGLPVGGSPASADPSFAPDMDGSALLKALNLADPYSAGPTGHGELAGLGGGDPNLGLEQMLQLLALGQMGVGSSGVTPDRGMPGQMMGF